MPYTFRNDNFASAHLNTISPEWNWNWYLTQDVQLMFPLMIVTPKIQNRDYDGRPYQQHYYGMG